MYAAGPGDIIGTFRHWREGRDDPSQVAATYSGQFYDLCQELEADGYAVSSHPRRESLSDGEFRLRHRPIPFGHTSGLASHLSHFWTAVWMTAAAFWYRADALVIGDGTCHWFPLRVLPRLGVAVIPTIHCVFWGKKDPPRPGMVQRVIRRLNRPLWSRSALSILSASGDITRQIEELARGACRPVIEFLPTYPAGTFPDALPPTQRNPFRVLFAGRIEHNKGVYDLLELARRFRTRQRTEIVFDLCGTGCLR